MGLYDLLIQNDVNDIKMEFFRFCDMGYPARPPFSPSYLPGTPLEIGPLAIPDYKVIALYARFNCTSNEEEYIDEIEILFQDVAERCPYIYSGLIHAFRIDWQIAN